MSNQNKTNTPDVLKEAHDKNPFDLARRNQDFQTEYDNAQDFYRNRPFVERFKSYPPIAAFIQNLGHVISGLSLTVGGVYTAYNYMFSDSLRNDYQAWFKVGLVVLIGVMTGVGIELAKNHFLKAWMKNRFSAKNALLGEVSKPNLGRWAMSLIIISLIGSTFFGFMGTYYLATDKAEIDTTYQTAISGEKEDLKAANLRAEQETREDKKRLENQIVEVNRDIANSCQSCYTMRRKMRAQISDINDQIKDLPNQEATKKAANKKLYADNVETINSETASTLDEDAQRASGNGWILGILTGVSDCLVVFCAWFIALYNDRLFKEGKHIGAINDSRIPQFSIDAIYANEMMEKHIQFLQMGGANLLLNSGGKKMLLPTNQIVLKNKKRKRKKSKKKDKKIVKNPIGFHTLTTGKTDVDFEAKNEDKNETHHKDSNSKNSPKFDDSAEKDKSKNDGQFYSKNMLMNLNPETPYNLAKKYDMSKSEKQKLAQVRKVYMNFVKKEGKRPLLSELSGACGKSPNTVKKYVQRMEKDGQELLRRRGDKM